MSVEFDSGSPGKFDSRTLNRETLSRGIGRITDWYDLRIDKTHTPSPPMKTFPVKSP